MERVYIFVTGGNRGIGKAIVLRFAKERHFVCFSYHSREKDAERTLNEVKKLGGDGFYVQMDVSDEQSVKKAYEQVKDTVPYLNVLINNAGVLHVSTIENTRLEDWNRVININLTGTFLVTKIFLPLLKKAPWASIVNIASVAGIRGNIVASAAYAASKAGVIALTRRLAIELAPKIRVNAVAPSFVETDMVREFIDTPEKRKRIAELHPLKSICTPNDVAEAVYFLAMPCSRYITGHTLVIDGGRFA